MTDRIPDSSATGPPASPRSVRKTTRYVVVKIVLVAVLLVVGMELGVLVSRSRTAESTVALADAKLQVGELRQAVSRSEERNWTYYREREALKTELARARSTQTSPPPTTHKTEGTDRHTYADGVYAVGKDISPGTYRGVVTGEVGHWARLKNTTGMIDGIIANAVPRGPFVLTIYPTDEAVELRGVELTAQR